MSNKNLNKLTEYRILIDLIKEIRTSGVYCLAELQQVKSEVIAKAEVIFGFDVEAINNFLTRKIQKAFEQKCYEVGVLITPPGFGTI